MKSYLYFRMEDDLNEEKFGSYDGGTVILSLDDVI